MAYMNQDKKAALAPGIKAVLKKYGMKASLAIDYSSLYVNIKSGPIDMFSDASMKVDPWGRNSDDIAYMKNRGYAQVNVYHIDSTFQGVAAKFLNELYAAMQKGNHDRSDVQSDYFDVGWYSHINIGRWNKPYTVA